MAKTAKPPYPGVSIIVPAYNEEVSIVECIRSLLALDYPEYEVIVVNDGSTDNTLKALEKAFVLDRIDDLEYTDKFGTVAPNAIFRSTAESRLIVLDKGNGGKADALNAGINISRYPLLCSIDADSILDPKALSLIVVPFQGDTDRPVAIVGGALAVANGSLFSKGELIVGGLPQSPWVLFQIVEYIRSFWVSRLGLSRYQLLLILSGAFTMFRKEILIKAGGFLAPNNRHPNIAKLGSKVSGTVCEDMEVVVRIRCFLRENGLRHRMEFLPWPICWTEVPELLSSLSRQRNRWQRGLCETIWYHRQLLFEPFYGKLGLLALPYYLLFEAISPIVRVFTIIFIVVLIFAGQLHNLFSLLLMISVILTGALALGITTIVVESWSRKRSPTHLRALRYRSGRDWSKLILAAMFSDLVFGTMRSIWQINGIRDFLRGGRGWGKFARTGLKS